MAELSTTQRPEHAPLVEVTRGPLVESVHYGSAVAVDGTGAVLHAAGDPHVPMYPRSANKPLQAAAMVRAGLELEPKLLALACASHAGEEFHVDGARRILADAGLTEADLRNTADLPLDPEVRNAHLAAGRTTAPIYANCSGKHAAMLATCVHNGWSTEDYLAQEHPLQRGIRDTIAELAGEPTVATAVDGCGAPLFGYSLTGLARAFAALADAPDGMAERAVATAVADHPQWVDGTGRTVTTLLERLPRAVAKSGAEGVLALALPGGPSVAVKIADGSQRGTAVALIDVLARLGVDTSAVADLATATVLGHGAPAGEVRPATGTSRDKTGTGRLP